MADIFLYPGETSPSDVKLRDPTVFIAAVAVEGPGYFAPLSVPLPVAQAQPGYAFVPFNTAQLSVNFTPFGWLSQPPLAPPVAQAQPGYSYVPFDTRQLSVNFTNFGWYQALSTPAPVARAQAGYSFVPLNTAQLSVNFTNFGWYEALSPAPAVAKAWQGDAFVPYNTAQLVPYTNFGWQRPLSPAPAVAKAVQGDSFVPFDTEQLPPPIGTPIDMGGLLPQARTVYAQARFLTPYPTPAVANTTAGMAWFNPLGVAASLAYAPQMFAFQPALVGQITAPTTADDDLLGDYSLIPLYRRKKHLKDELEEIELKLRDIALDIPLPGHSHPVIYDRPLLEPFSDKQQTIKVLVSRRARAQAEYEQLLKAQQDDDDDDSAILLLWP